MSSSRPIPEQTAFDQRRAATPTASAWVSANAGSGKTHVLTQRVMGLLLAGAHPSKILCLTFTKAAAANMSQRIFKTLSDWTKLDDASLTETIRRMGAGAPSSASLSFARRLFARAIETPGGLKIQTIHAFCEALLHRFPFEANVPAGFQILDDEEREELMRSAKRRALARAADDERLADSLTRLTADVSAMKFDKALDEALRTRKTLSTIGPAEALADRVGDSLRSTLGLRAKAGVSDYDCDIVEGGLSRQDWLKAAELLADGSKIEIACATKIRNAFAQASLSESAICLMGAMLTVKGQPRSTLFTQTFAKEHPAVADALLLEQERIFNLREKRLRAFMIERTQALLSIVARVIETYEHAKRSRGLLDFDDLIERSERLLRHTDSAWVHYKLDAGIDHILIDEAQDTSETQWSIVRSLVEEFTAGEGARRAARTIFAVGDEKQSIYSFQGAAPHFFDRMRRHFSLRHRDAQKEFHDVRLVLSFRSSSAILEAVDTVFAAPERRSGLTADDDAQPLHEAWKKDLPGLVELWDLLTPPEKPEERDWRLPLDSLTASDPEAVLASRIAASIASWTSPSSSETVFGEHGPRRIQFGDVLVLMRTRGRLFDAIVRALKERGIPVAGADRLKLVEHIAVMDLMAAGWAGLLPEDDLNLACLLKSPLIGLDDDDLLLLAPSREGTLWRALESSPQIKHRAAFDKISEWRTAAVLGPFDFYSRILSADQGRKALSSRLGPEASDAIDEFLSLALDHQKRRLPSLGDFLYRMEASDISIKRDMEAAGASVRVMTVHASKGLEAKIVILPDSAKTPSDKSDPNLFFLNAATGPVPIYSPRKDGEPTEIAEARETIHRLRAEEYRRLLYVAMTRAEERLYVAGIRPASNKPTLVSWYDLIEEALTPLLIAEPASWNKQESVRRFRRLAPLVVAPDDVIQEEPHRKAETPSWLNEKAHDSDVVRKSLRPSTVRRDGSSQTSGGVDRRQAIRHGILTHALIQRLPSVPDALRMNVATLYLRTREPDISEADIARIFESAVAVLREPRLAHFFTPQSRAEVSICSRVTLARGVQVDVVGTIDRIAVTDDTIWIADFKTGVFRGTKAPDEYLAQMALYAAAVAPLWPNRPVRAILIWTGSLHISELSKADLEQGLDLASA